MAGMLKVSLLPDLHTELIFSQLSSDAAGADPSASMSSDLHTLALRTCSPGRGVKRAAS